MRLINNEGFAADAKMCCTSSKDGLPQHFTDAVSRICACVFAVRLPKAEYGSEPCRCLKSVGSNVTCT